MEAKIGSSMWSTRGLGCVERSFIAAGYMSLGFKRGVEAADINQSETYFLVIGAGEHSTHWSLNMCPALYHKLHILYVI